MSNAKRYAERKKRRDVAKAEMLEKLRRLKAAEAGEGA
jgi:hypothetical protein